MNHLISIIIPIYNAERYLVKCVESVITQTYQNLQIILVNDGSTDHSYSTCKELSEKYDNIVLVNQENQGVSSARNRGMEIADGEYFFFLDADDTLPPDAILSLYQAAQKTDADMAIGKLSENEKIPIGTFTEDAFLIKALEDNPITYYSCRILYKHAFAYDLKFPAGYVIAEDSYFVFLCALKKPKVVTINEVVYHYTVVDTSASRSSFTITKYDNICSLLAKKEEILKENYKSLLPLFFHLKVKIQMALLKNLMYTRGSMYRIKEKEAIKNFKKYKAYFKPELPYSNTHFYHILSRNLYTPYKFFENTKRQIKKGLFR